MRKGAPGAVLETDRPPTQTVAGGAEGGPRRGSERGRLGEIRRSWAAGEQDKAVAGWMRRSHGGDVGRNPKGTPPTPPCLGCSLGTWRATQGALVVPEARERKRAAASAPSEEEGLDEPAACFSRCTRARARYTASDWGGSSSPAKPLKSTEEPLWQTNQIRRRLPSMRTAAAAPPPPDQPGRVVLLIRHLPH